MKRTTNTDAELREMQRRLNNELIAANVCPQCLRNRVVFMCGSECSHCRAEYEQRSVWFIRARHIGFIAQSWKRRIKRLTIKPQSEGDIPFQETP